MKLNSPISGVLAVLLLALALPFAAAKATPGAASGESGVASCRQAALAAERRHNIPAGLLAAIARVESGRGTDVRGEISAWPWTINAAGQGSYHDSKQAAIAAVDRLRESGVKSIDVGCMQVNLVHHPEAFDNLEAAFDPATNADYAAQFVIRLFKETRSWSRAVSFYHSRDPERALAYKTKVMSAWTEERGVALESIRQQHAARVGTNTSAAARMRIGRQHYISTTTSGARIRTY